MQITMKLDTREFDKTMKEYVKWTTRQPAEIVNAKLYFIALNAMNETKTTNAQIIRSSLNSPSRKYPNRSIGEILTYIQLRKKGKFPRKSATLTQKVEKFIKRRVGHIQFLRSGWIPAMKKLNYWNKRGDITFVRKNAPKMPKGIKQFGVNKGDVVPARQNSIRAVGTIYNFIGEGKQDSKTVHGLLVDGLQKAINREVREMKNHINQKFEAKHSEMKRKGQI